MRGDRAGRGEKGEGGKWRGGRGGEGRGAFDTSVKLALFGELFHDKAGKQSNNSYFLVVVVVIYGQKIFN